MSARYDQIGVDYARLRKPDPRIAKRIDAALGDAESVLNVGAGAGSYEPADRQVTALEPSIEMIGQRPNGPVQVVQGRAEALPFADRAFEASMAVLTIHHWTDKAKGLAEMRRVTRGRIVILTYDPSFRGYWLADYIPELVGLDEMQMPKMEELEAWLGPCDIISLPVPNDCVDGFLCAYWQRPGAYLDSRIRAAISSFWTIGDVSGALDRLRGDLDSGAWEARYGNLLELDEYDCGYRLVTAEPG